MQEVSFARKAYIEKHYTLQFVEASVVASVFIFGIGFALSMNPLLPINATAYGTPENIAIAEAVRSVRTTLLTSGMFMNAMMVLLHMGLWYASKKEVRRPVQWATRDLEDIRFAHKLMVAAVGITMLLTILSAIRHPLPADIPAYLTIAAVCLVGFACFYVKKWPIRNN